MKFAAFLTTAFAIFLSAQALRAQEPLLDLLSEDTLRTLVAFGADDGLKYAECEDKRFLTCSYVWGVPDEDDAARVKMGGLPDGKKLLLIAAKAERPSDFDRVLASYKDAEPAEGLGEQAVWSAARGQLSMLTADSAIIHVNTERTGDADPRATAIAVATHLLSLR